MFLPPCIPLLISFITTAFAVPLDLTTDPSLFLQLANGSSPLATLPNPPLNTSSASTPRPTNAQITNILTDRQSEVYRLYPGATLFAIHAYLSNKSPDKGTFIGFDIEFRTAEGKSISTLGVVVSFMSDARVQWDDIGMLGIDLPLYDQRLLPRPPRLGFWDAKNIFDARISGRRVTMIGYKISGPGNVAPTSPSPPLRVAVYQAAAKKRWGKEMWEMQISATTGEVLNFDDPI